MRETLGGLIAASGLHGYVLAGPEGEIIREIGEEELKKGAGTQFDPQIVPHMLAIIADEAAGLGKGR